MEINMLDCGPISGLDSGRLDPGSLLARFLHVESPQRGLYNPLLLSDADSAVWESEEWLKEHGQAKEVVEEMAAPNGAPANGIP